jgi:hypothetical protein
MAVDVTVESVGSAPRVRTGPLARVSPAVWLAALVTVSFGTRLAVAFLHPITNLFPDEYIYAELGRGFATHGLPLVRGHVANFPSLLVPLLTSPAWLVHDVGISLRIVQTMTTLSMSLAAVPAYLLARRLRFDAGVSLGVAAVALAVPDFLYSSAVLAGPFAYPLSLWATLAGLTALERPSLRRQAGFAALCLATMLARAQFVELPLAFALAAVAVGLRERRLGRAIREQAPVLAAVVLGAVAVAVLGLGFYGGVTHLLGLGKLPYPLVANTLLLLLASGWVLVPGALVGLGLAFVRPLDRLELLFGAFASVRVVAMVLEAAVYGDQAHERYVFYAVPLLAIGFALYVRRGCPFRLVHAVFVVGLLVLALRLPLGRILANGHTNSATLYALYWLDQRVGGVGAASTVVMNVLLGASVLMLLLLARFPRAAARFALVFAVGFGTATWAAAADFEHASAGHVRAAVLPGDRSWVDDQHVGPVTMLRSFNSDRTDVFEQLFWNRSVDRMLALSGTQRLEPFSMPDVTVRPDGTLLSGGTPVRGPLLLDQAGSTLAMRGGKVTASAPQFDLWVPGAGPAHLLSYFAGRTKGGLLLPLSVLELWPQHTGTVRLVFTVPAGGPESIRIRISLPAGGRMLTMPPGSTRRVDLGVCAASPWTAAIHILQGPAVVVSKPVFRPGGSPCRATVGANA